MKADMAGDRGCGKQDGETKGGGGGVLKEESMSVVTQGGYSISVGGGENPDLVTRSLMIGRLS